MSEVLITYRQRLGCLNEAFLYNYFPTSSSTLRLSCACSLWLSIFAIWIIFLSRWKVRSMDSGGSSLRFNSCAAAVLTASSRLSSSAGNRRRGSGVLLWRSLRRLSPSRSEAVLSPAAAALRSTSSSRWVWRRPLPSSQPGRLRGLPAAGRRCDERRTEERSRSRGTGFMSCEHTDYTQFSHRNTRRPTKLLTKTTHVAHFWNSWTSKWCKIIIFSLSRINYHNQSQSASC